MRATSTAHSAMCRIALATTTTTRTQTSIVHCPSWPSSTFSRPLSAIITVHRPVYSSTRRLQHPSSLKDIGPISKTRTRAFTPSTAFGETTKQTPAASLSTRKVATLTSTSSSLGLDSAATSSRPIIISKPLHLSATSANNRATKTTIRKTTAPSNWATRFSPSAAFPSYNNNLFKNPDSYQTKTQTKGSKPLQLPFLDFRTNDSREVMYTKSDEEADQWLNSNPSKMYALDAEWKAFGQYGKQCRMSLIQLGDDRTVYLFHVIHMKKFPEALARILQDKSILKVGINIRNDGTKMFKDWGIGCASLVELGALCVQVLDDLPNQRKIRSMERLANELLGHSVEKMSLLRMGNWESKNLSANQLAYAANDVFVTYEVAEKIKELQRSRSKQEFWVPLATIHSKGATVVTVRGSLQERQDHPASTKDIVVLKSGAGATAAASKAEMQEKSGGVKRSTGYTKVSSAKVAGSSPTSRRKNANAASSTSSAATAPTTATGASTKAPSKATKKTAAKAFKRISPKPPNRSAMVTAATSSSNDLQSPPPTPPPYSYMSVNGDPNFFYGNIGSNTSTSGTNNVIRAIRHGSRSTVTIIPAKSQKRYISCSSQRPSSSSSSSSSTLTTEGDKAETKDDSERKQNGVRGGDVYFPSQLLPESLEGKGTLERNQSIWQEAGGRDLSEELGSALEEEQDDWYLRQNQALFASLVSDEEKEK